MKSPGSRKSLGNSNKVHPLDLDEKMKSREKKLEFESQLSEEDIDIIDL